MWLTVTNILMFLVLEDLGGYTRVQKYASEGRCTLKQLNGTVFFFSFFLICQKTCSKHKCTGAGHSAE